MFHVEKNIYISIALVVVKKAVFKQNTIIQNSDDSFILWNYIHYINADIPFNTLGLYTSYCWLYSNAIPNENALPWKTLA